jgi:cobalt-zinc-cadmium efflux system membrane fusion protein
MYKKSFMRFFALLAVSIVVAGRASAEEGHGHEEGEHEEGVVTLSATQQRTAGVAVQAAGPASLKINLRVNGRIAPVSSKVAHIAPRFAGVIREVRKDIGDSVEAGELLAVVESNQALQSYEVRASKPGVVTNRHATVGESVAADEPLFVVMDLSQVWADFVVFQRDVSRIRAGQVVKVTVSGAEEPITSTISFISPLVDEATQSRIARAVVPNPSGQFSVGAFLTGEIATGEFQVSLAVRDDAIQTVDGKQVVFVSEGERFRKKEIATGRSDGQLTEVVSGLNAGEKYAAGNSFVLKAELGKGEAEHED